MHCQSRSAVTFVSRSHAATSQVSSSRIPFSLEHLSQSRTELRCIGSSHFRSLHAKADVTQIKVLQPFQQFLKDSLDYHKNYYKNQDHQNNQQKEKHTNADKTDTATEAESGAVTPWTAFWTRTLERLSSPERKSGYLWVVTLLALADVLYTLFMGQGSESDIEEALKGHDDETIVGALLAYVETSHTLDVGMEGEERRKKMLHTLARNSAALEVLFRGLATAKGAEHFFNCVTILSELMEDEISCNSVCAKLPFESVFNRNKAGLLNSLSDVQRFMLFYLLQQCSHNEIGLQRMVNQDTIIKALMSTFQKYQQNEIVKIQQSGSSNVSVLQDVTANDLKVHMASQVAILLTIVNLSAVESARQLLKSNEGFMRVLHVVASMHRNPSLKGTADSAFLNITKNAQIKAPTVDVDKSVHKYTRSNTLTFYATTLTMGFSYGLFWALRGNMLYGGLKGAALLSKSITNAVTTSAGTFMLGGFIRDAQAVATNPKVRQYTEQSSGTHCAYTAGKIAYLGIGAFVMNAAFPHIFVPSIMANMCLSPVIKGVETIQQVLKERNATKVAPQKKLAQ